jgi:hypothetical protein
LDSEHLQVNGVSHLCRIQNDILNIASMHNLCPSLVGFEPFLKDGSRAGGPAFIVNAVVLNVYGAEQVLNNGLRTAWKGEIFLYLGIMHRPLVRELYRWHSISRANSVNKRTLEQHTIGLRRKYSKRANLLDNFLYSGNEGLTHGLRIPDNDEATRYTNVAVVE